MKIDLDQLKECDGCGVVFNYISVSTTFDSDIIEGNCPNCHKEYWVSRE